jgi:hypothetical protein|tara:strand:+ start:395 stop:1141 length:747 start_codon:yes stop_codon:yes gene_type:complete
MSESIENILLSLVRDTNKVISSNNDKMASMSLTIEQLTEKVEILTESNKILTDKIESMSSKPKPKASKPKNTEPRVQCTFMTKKGNQCKKYCIEGCNTCKQHASMSQEKASTDTDTVCPPCIEPQSSQNTETNTSDDKVIPKPIVRKKRPIVKKKKDPPPKHNHAPGEIPKDPCSLCISHGDVLDPDMPDAKFKGAPIAEMSLEERLRLAIEEDEASSNTTNTVVTEPVINNNTTSWADMCEDEENNE